MKHVGDTNYSWCFWNAPTKDLGKKLEELEIKGRIETIETTALDGIFRRVLEEFWKPQETCCHSDSSERPPAEDTAKHSQGVK